MTSINKCCVCFDNIPKQVVNLLSCEHDCLCVNCAMEYFKKENKCPICRKQIDGSISIDGKIMHVNEIYTRSRSNTESYLFATRSISVNSNYFRNSESLENDIDNSANVESVVVICSLCGGELDINWIHYQRCGCEKNKSFACQECMDNNPEFTVEDICDDRCSESRSVTESEYYPSPTTLLFSSATQSPIQNRNHGAQINIEFQNDGDNPEEKADEPQINVEENNGDNSEQNEEEKKDQNLDEIGNLFRQDVDTNSNRNLGEINNLFEQNIGANSNSNLNEINNLLDANLDKIDVKFEQDEKLTNGAEKQEQNLDAIDKKERVSLNWILYDTTNHNKKNEEEEKEEEQKLYSRTISKTISIASSEEERTPQIDNVGNHNKHGCYMSQSPAKLRPATLLLSEKSKQKQFPMVISSRKRSLRKSLSVERKVELEAIKEEISDDSELDLIIENDSIIENPLKKIKLN